jgi:hypothetical protein
MRALQSADFGSERCKMVLGIEEICRKVIEKLPDDEAQVAQVRVAKIELLRTFKPSKDPLYQALFECIQTFEEKRKGLNAMTAASRETIKEPMPDLHARPTITLPAQRDTGGQKAFAPKVVEEEWGKSEQLLYEDVMNLFALGDQQGAMTSLERLIMVAPNTPTLMSFIAKNKNAFHKVYIDQIGSLDRLPYPVTNRDPTKIPTSDEHFLMDILRLVDGKKTIAQIVSASGREEVVIMAVITHLARCGFIEFG